ncbi:AAA domain-containing protein [Streptacidiphilus sp. MAP5-52]|uniref:AAA domain-containing protein n=1 Tax=Streptacidiphilus sp. MAP5-52 TaxID=3156267 RepID=UPI0035122FE3
MTAQRRQRAAVVGFWHAVEMFSPQQIPQVSPAQQVYRARAGAPLPWQDGHELREVRLEPGFAWQHVVYGGVFDFAAVRQTLLSVFGGDEKDYDGRMDGQSSLFAFTVDDEGRLLLDSPVFATCPWATGRALSSRRGQPGWLDGFDDVSEEWTARSAELGRLDPGEGNPAAVPPSHPRDAEATGPHGAAATALRSWLPERAGSVARSSLEPQPITGTTLSPADPGQAGAAHEGPQPEPADDAGTAGAEDPHVGAHRIGFEDLDGFTRELASKWGVDQALKPVEIRVRSVIVREDRAADADQQDFLNSFIAKDLRQVSRELTRVDPGPALEAFLTPASGIDTRARTDLREHPAAAFAWVVPGNTPLGRWLAEPGHPLALSQQVAVNAAASQLRHGGVFAVNGPPGTGKTTALRDDFAAVIVERARLLAELRLPSQAFVADESRWHRWKSGDYTRTVQPLLPRFTGFEMVVASANNGAVENISTEIPARAAIAKVWRDGADYFAEQATRLLQGEPAWGAVAARLGSKKNRGEFVNRFWHGKYRHTDAPMAGDPPPPPSGSRRRDGWIDTGRGLSHLLAGWSQTSQSGVWRTAKNAFAQALARIEELQGERDAAAVALGGLSSAHLELQAALDREQAAEAEVVNRHYAQGSAVAGHRDAATAAESAERRRTEHHARRPGFTVALFTLGRAARDWHRQDQLLAAQEQAAAARAKEAARAVEAAAAEVRAAQASAAAAASSVQAAREEVALLEQTAAEAVERWGDHVPDGTWWADERVRELSAPWADEEITIARSELFLAALDLHHAFVRCTAKTMRRNLMAAMDVVSGSAPKTLAPDARLAAWQSLFLVVPVVSTTFASLDRVFTGLGREALGWLFVDEAGQAPPQMAVGALWRAKRAVVVGDPLQLEPVVILPFTVQQALRRDFGVGEEWLPARTSVQQLTDRHNRWGTTLLAEQSDGSDEVWVGAPLRVHRRCEDPMFAVSNDIAYDGLMVYGTSYRDPSPYRPDSSWVHVASTVCEGHWIPAEGRALIQVLEKLRASGVDVDRDVFVLSPFRDVVRGAKRATRGLIAPERVGTVHTAQGKEADIVLLVLGTDPKAGGARSWAAKRPNLLNVAVSRAKRRLFVIGNHDLWREQLYYRVLAERLRVHHWTDSG